MLAVAGLSFASKAQMYGFEKGNVILEGAIGVNSSDNQTKEIKTSSFNIAPKIGYFLSDKGAIGVQLGYGESKETDYSGSKDTYTKGDQLHLGVFGRYYLLEVGSRFKAYGEAAVGYTSAGGERNNGTTTTKFDKVNSFDVNAGIGANFFLTEKIAIGYQFTDLIAFNTAKLNTSGAKSTNNFRVNLNSFDNFFNAGQFSLTFKF